MITTLRRRRLLAASLAAGLLALSSPAGADTPPGLPLLRSVVPGVEDSAPQSFALGADSRGLLYVGNLFGLLTFDGARWNSVEVGDQAVVWSIAVDASGRVAVGGTGDFGLVEPDSQGRLTYVSLSSKRPVEERNFEQVLGVQTTREGFAFLAESRLWLWNGQSITKVAEFANEGPAPSLHANRGQVFLWTASDGLRRLDGDQLAPVPGGEQFRNERVRAVLTGPAGDLVVAQRAGLSRWQDGRVTPFAPGASAWCRTARLMTGIDLPAGGWALGSLLDGILTLRPDGSIDRLIDSKNGLPDDFVYDLVIDHEGALWAALNSDLVRIEVGQPVTVYDRRMGLEGTPYAVARHRGQLYVATAAGLFTPENGGDDSGPRVFRAVPGFRPSVWSLLSHDEDLLVGTNEGLWVYREGRLPTLVDGFAGTVYTLRERKDDASCVWVGLDDGFGVACRGPGGWVLERRLAVNANVRGIDEEDGRVWISSDATELLAMDLPLPPTGQEKLIAVAGSEPASALFRIGGELIAAVDEGFMRLDTANARFVPDPALDRFTADGRRGLLREDAAGNVWRTTRPVSIVLRGEGSGPSAIRTLPELSARSVEILFLDDDGAMWLAGENGLYRWPRDAAAKIPEPTAPLLESVTSGSTVLRSGRPGVPPATIDLPASLRRLRLNFAPLSFRTGLRYQTRLDPLDSEWSTSSPEPFSELTRLAPGDYTFRVRTVVSELEISPETTWSFRVLPPWYRTPWAFLGAAGIALISLRGYGRLRSRSHAQRAARLQTQVDLQTIELRRTVDELQRTQGDLQTANARLEELSQLDELTGVANRRRLRTVLETEWSRAARHERPISFLMLDLDQFKLLNDTRGHHEGDRCLVQVAQFLDGAVRRRTDLLVRYGGEEFAVLLPDTDLAGAVEVAEALREGIEELAILHEAVPQGRVTASIGVASLVPLVGQRPEILIEAADRALYRAKSEGRNRVLAEGDGSREVAAAN